MLKPGFIVALLLVLAGGAFAAFCPGNITTGGAPSGNNLPTCNFFVASATAPAPGVSPGSDSNNGLTQASAFATLGKAQTVARGVTQKVICVRAGTFVLNGLNLTAADNGETWQYYQPDGVNTAVLDGGNTDTGLFNLNNASNVTINGLRMQNVNALFVFGTGNSLVLENCDISSNHSGNSGLGFGGFAPALGLTGTNMLVSHNYLHNTVGTAIGLYAFSAGSTVDGSVVTGNFTETTGFSVNDNGAIYVDMHATNINGGHVTISNNFVRNYGGNGSQSEGIYLDDDTSNATVTGNIIGPPDASMNTFGNFRSNTLVNAGISNTFKNNLWDLGPTAGDAGNWISLLNAPGGGGSLFFNWPAGAVNDIDHNIIISGYSATSLTTRDGVVYDEGAGYPVAAISIHDNTYHNYGGGIEASNGTVLSDTNPIHADPHCTGSTYVIGTLPAGFTTIQTGWGPPGFTPTATTNKSCPGT